MFVVNPRHILGHSYIAAVKMSLDHDKGARAFKILRTKALHPIECASYKSHILACFMSIFVVSVVINIIPVDVHGYWPFSADSVWLHFFLTQCIISQYDCGIYPWSACPSEHLLSSLPADRKTWAEILPEATVPVAIDSSGIELKSFLTQQTSWAMFQYSAPSPSSKCP